MTDHRGGYDYPDYEPFMRGEVEVPNFVEVSAGEVLNVIAGMAGLEFHSSVRCARLPSNTSTHAPWARYFLTRTQGGRLDGGGYVVVYDSRYADGKSLGGRAGRFAICKHEKEVGPGAVPSRGWHPGHCRLCGLDMTVDSGD